jgi:ATP-dependent phosphofructokinase / diphosphate-dependent phosphofructokinase
LKPVNAIVGQSGGPTSVINSSLAGIIAGCRSQKIGRLLGMRWGIEGFLADRLVNLSAESPATVRLLRRTPSSALGSSRHKVREEDLGPILKRLREYNIRYLFMIGGNDTMDTLRRVKEHACAHGYDMAAIGVPKTVDNDLYGTDHAPGYASAARYVALSVQQAGRLARDMRQVDQFVVHQCIGRDAGWLSCAAALAKKNEDDAPHLIYAPERVFDRDRFLGDVEAAHKKYGYVFVVCGEGIKYANGAPVSASGTRDKFSNIEFGAMGGASAAIDLHRMIAAAFGWRGEFQVTESLPMCAIDRGVKLDLDEAFLCGKTAVRLALTGQRDAMVSLVRDSSSPYRCATGATPLREVAARAKPMDDEMINKAGNFPTRKFIEYARPLVGPMPQFAELDYVPARQTRKRKA